MQLRLVKSMVPPDFDKDHAADFDKVTKLFSLNRAWLQ